MDNQSPCKWRHFAAEISCAPAGIFAMRSAIEIWR